MVQRSEAKILQKGDIDWRSNIKRGYLVNEIDEQMNFLVCKLQKLKIEIQKTKTIYI